MKTKCRHATLVLLFASMLTESLGGCALARAGEDPGKIVFSQKGAKAKDAKPLEPPEKPPEEKEPPVPLEEVEGPFTACTAARVMQLDLARRISAIDPGRAMGKTWTKYSNSQALSDRWRERIARDEECGSDADPGMAERIMALYRTAVDFPDLRRRAATRAPLTLSTVAEAGRLLDRVEGILDGRQLRPILKPRKADLASAGAAAREHDDPERQRQAELDRRARLLAAALARINHE